MEIGPENVTLDDTRSGGGGAGTPDKCFYCSGRLGEPHDYECVCPSRLVVVRMTIEAIVSRPRSWDSHSIEFHMNDSSWCADNFFDDLPLNDEPTGPCMCNVAKFEYLRDASQEDIETLWMAVDEDVRALIEGGF